MNTVDISGRNPEIASLQSRFVASMILGGAGDAMGFRGAAWEFNFSGPAIHEELNKMGGVSALNIALPAWPVSDDTILAIATGEGLLNSQSSSFEDICMSIAANYNRRCRDDMVGRSPGPTCLLGARKCKRSGEGWRNTPFSTRGGGCGAAMRACPVGLYYSKPNQLNELVAVAIESGRMTHHHPTGYLGAVVAAAFTSFAIQSIPPVTWGMKLFSDILPLAKIHIEQEQRDVAENLAAFGYFESAWMKYLSLRGILNGDETTQPIFPDTFGDDVALRDQFYESISFSGWGGSSGHDSVIIAYDALLGSLDNWEELCRRGMLHGGDNDSTGILAGSWFGALFGFEGSNVNLSQANYANLEYRDLLTQIGNDLFLHHNSQEVEDEKE